MLRAGTDADNLGIDLPGQRCPGWESNPHCMDFEAIDSAGWSTGAGLWGTGWTPMYRVFGTLGT
jgi:hypothetical protein